MGTLAQEPCQRLVWPEERAQGALRDVCPSGHGGAKARRDRTPSEEQPDEGSVVRGFCTSSRAGLQSHSARQSFWTNEHLQSVNFIYNVCPHNQHQPIE